MKRKLLTVVLAAVMTVLAALAFVGCGSDDNPPAPPDTFYKGTVSQQTYTTAENAAKGFLQNEVNGETTFTTFESYTKEGEDLTEEEIATLAIPEELIPQITAVEKGVVAYRDTDSPKLNGALTSDVTTVKLKHITIYIITLGSDYKYFAPELEKGDVVTKSYYEQATNVANYVNMTATSNTKSSVSVQGIEIMSVTVKVDMKVADRYMWYSIGTTVSSLFDSQTDKQYYFVVFDQDISQGSYSIYRSTDNKNWYYSHSAGTPILQDITGKDVDYSYFVKTPSGFKVNPDKYSSYVQKALKDVDMIEEVGATINSVSASAEFYVYDGRVNKYEGKVTAEVTVEGETGTVTAKCVETYSGFGTTTLQVPDGITV